MERTRTYGYVDPLELAAVARATDGLTFTRQLVSGEQGPIPIFSTLGYQVTEIEEGRAMYVGNPAEYVYNPLGSVHGGYAAAILDSAASSAVQSTLPPGVGFSTIHLSVRYLRPIFGNQGEVRAVGTVKNRGRRTALAEVEMRDAQDRLVAQGTGSFMLLPPD
ncbi:PaaI family thioesterase [Kribbella sp. NPDC051587]|uniref:PaaI family thioesterase n=1 Tax=Kribbella sp. NPDC051587 TaxID=3364119 RepID=UPI0037B3F1F2